MLYNIIKFFAKIHFKLFNRLEVIGRFEKNDDDRVVLCSNHSSFLDPLILAVSVQPEIHFMGKQELFKNPILSYIFRKLNAFPVNRQESDISSLKNAIRLVKDGKVLGIFIEGTRVKSYNPNNAKSGPILIAKMSGATIQPVYIESNYTLFGKTKVYIRDRFELPIPDKSDKSVDYYQVEAENVLNKIYNG